MADTVKVSQLSIPGTHDSGGFYGGDWAPFTRPFAVTQSLSLETQLNAGIRYLDIRLGGRAGYGDLAVYHGDIFENESWENDFNADKKRGFISGFRI
ncbi:hypothetical protein [Bacillus toyonensis]|uniref:hypothetical protein n=1 Tax=Bacillus toyonensis TaxID=155322 RepID=UPI00100A7DEE|nr:hypothetical protein [Bacillus toyonensis]